MKFCDIEFVIIMGIINWFRRGFEFRSLFISVFGEFIVLFGELSGKLRGDFEKKGLGLVKLEGRGF